LWPTLVGGRPKSDRRPHATSEQSLCRTATGEQLLRNSLNEKQIEFAAAYSISPVLSFLVSISYRLPIAWHLGYKQRASTGGLLALNQEGSDELIRGRNAER
jgi:hypothetical protein